MTRLRALSLFTLLLATSAFAQTPSTALSVHDAQSLIRSIDAFNNQDNPFHPDHCTFINPPVQLSDAPTCIQHYAYLNSRYHNKITPDDVVARLAQDPNRIFIIGDTHANPVEQNFHRILLQLKEAHPDINCLFVEFPPSYSPVIDLISQGQMLDGAPRQLAPEMLNKIMVAARQAGLKIIPVDDEIDSLAKEQTIETVQNRNHVMADHVLTNLGNGTCRKSVFVVGALHLWSEQGFDTITTLLEQGGYRSTSTFPIDTGCSPTTGQANPWWSRSECARQAENQTAEYAFTNPAGAPADEHWSDYNYTWIFPAKFGYDCQPSSR